MSEMTIHDILKALPHRYPFLLVDRVVECDGQKNIVAIKNVTANEPFFQGHFPDDPVMPGVLQIEAMAQVGGVLLNRRESREGLISYFLAIDNAKFRKIVRPGDQLRIEVEILRWRLGMGKVRGKITVDGDVTCEAELMFGYGQDQ